MLKYLVKLYDWENPRLCSSGSELSVGERVVVSSDFGNDLGVIQEVGVETKSEAENVIVRRATPRDNDVFDENKKKKEEIAKVCQKKIRKDGLEMKLIDVHITLGKGNILIIFTADGRVDFRDLVKDLSGIFHRSVRMQQIGSRDEARKLGGCGICGKELCCVRFSGNLPSISTEMAKIQQVSHRGSDRISGLCGRLMCCLSYEVDQYRKMLKGMPELQSTVRTEKGKGIVIEINALNQKIKIRLEGGQIITVEKNEIK
jgi:cell fate regulator YaaT (PSP1 superfamily)